MTQITPEVEAKLRQGFHYLNKGMLLMWRLGLGQFMNRRELSGQIMVITHVGRKSGQRRRTPVNYALYDGDIYCTAGFGRVSDWYRNILHNPNVEIWLPAEDMLGPVGWWAGVAEDISDEPQAFARLREVLVASGFAAYAFGANPAALSDEDLAGLLKSYRVVRIRRQSACTGPGGPGDLSWVWPLAAMFMLPLAWRGLTRRK